MSTGRLEAFSDGVIAIAITLLVLDIKVPAPGDESLAHALGQMWPNYAAYVISFLTIGVIWINHNAMLRRAARADHTTLVLNLLLLMFVAALPFTTALMSEYLRESDGQHLAAAVYGASFLGMSLAFIAMQQHILRTPGVARPDIDEETKRRIIRRNGAGLLPYVAATAVAPVSSYLTLVICGAVAGYYALPSTTSDARGEGEAA